MNIAEFKILIENEDEFLQEIEKAKSLINQLEEVFKKIDGMKMIVRLVKIESDPSALEEPHQHLE